jgi:DNA-binding transcriptional MocR family regulator
MTRPLAERSTTELAERRRALAARFDQMKAQKLSLDLTRGKPAADQLALSDALDGCLAGDYRASDGTDVRNYGGLRGIPEARALGAELLGVAAADVLAAGNSSLTLMYQIVEAALSFGLPDARSAWRPAGERSTPVRFLCPVPGYDRHFTICQALGIDMVPVPLGDDGPDMDAVERAVAEDPSIKAIWCVPKYSNPTGCVYADATVARLARLPRAAGTGFLVLWDNAYAVHDLVEDPPKLADMAALARREGTFDHVVMFASTSKITFAGAGVAFLAGSKALLDRFEKYLSAQEIGPDKVNQLRHARFLAGRLDAHMRAHARLIRPKFEAVLARLEQSLGSLGVASWTAPKGGYFISFDTRPGLARRVVALAKEAGVTLTPAGSTWPNGQDPNDSNIRIAPTFPSLADVEAATEVFTLCVELASVEQILVSRGAV